MVSVDPCTRALIDVFGFPSYKGKQQEIVEAALQGRDVFVVAPTGMGKSLCFQIPAVATECGISIVVSPLLALIKNQIEKLRSKAVSASALSSDTPKEEKNDIMNDLSSNESSIRLLYITPERLCTNDFMNLLQHLYSNSRINRLVVDEAHCISEWGHDFRAEYRRLGIFRERFPSVPIMALTATATPTVQSDIIQSLKMDKEHLYQALHPFNRENLFYEVRYLSAPEPNSQMADIRDYIWNLHRRRGRTSSGIIYCRTRATCDSLSTYLRGQGLNARPYHRGLRPHALDKTLKQWTDDDGVDIVVATIAFGLGIDKSDVRYVMHYDLSKSFEGYYQETGRAGRDGLPAKCILYYSREDALTVQSWVTGAHSRRLAGARNGPAPSQRSIDSLNLLIQFAESTTTCRHILICRYFGEHIDARDANVLQEYCSKMCDICKYPERTKQRHGKLSLKSSALSPDDEDQPNLRNDNFEHNFDKRQPNADGRPLHERSKIPAKRSNDQSANRNHKKIKVEMAPALVTKSFDSEMSLKKPFKTPFLPLKVSENVPEPPQPMDEGLTISEVPELADVEAQTIIMELDMVTDTSMDVYPRVPFQSNKETYSRSPVSYEDADNDIVLDASFSSKIPLPLRYDGYRRIKRTLSKVFASDDVCDKMNCGAVKSDESVLSKVTKEIEFMVFSFSKTSQGYEIHVNQRVDIIKAYPQRTTWDATDDDYEIAQELLDILAQYHT